MLSTCLSTFRESQNLSLVVTGDLGSCMLKHGGTDLANGDGLYSGNDRAPVTSISNYLNYIILSYTVKKKSIHPCGNKNKFSAIGLKICYLHLFDCHTDDVNIVENSA